MNRSAVFLMYGASLVLTVAPLLHILLNRSFRTYYVYFVAVAGYVVFNVAYCISPNILGSVDSPQFYAMILVTAFALAALYVLLIVMAGAMAERGMAGSVRAPAPSADLHHRRVFVLLAAGATGLTAAFFAIARPTLLRVDLFGDWLGLMTERSRVMAEAPMFGWFSVFFWDIPALLMVLAVLVRMAHLREGDAGAAVRWRRNLWGGLPVAVFFSVAYFHVLQLAYMLAAMLLAAFVVRGGIPVRLLLRNGIPAAAAIVLMYVAKTGAGFSREAMEATGELLKHRLFEVYAWSGAVATYVFPREHPFLDGRSFVNFMGLFNYEQVNLSAWVFPYIYAGAENGGAPVPAIMEGWANFGWPGALGTLAVVVALIAGVTWMSWTRQPLIQALSIYLATKLLLVWQAPLWFGILAPPMVLFILLVWCAYRILRPVPAAPVPYGFHPPAAALR